MNTIHNIHLLDQSSLLVINGLLDKIRPLIAIQPNGLDEDMRCELMKRTQQLAIEVRQFYSRAPTDSDHDADRSKLLDLGYRCERVGQTVRIELPLLLPKRGGDSSFITELLHQLLSLENNIQRFQNCTVMFCHIYGERKKIANVLDHDNVETRAVLNVIERYFLVSDSGYYCANVHITEFGHSNKTVITLLPGKLDIHKIREAVIA